MTSKGETAM
uniref:Ubc protein n=1 Tax=Solanum lycopersicum TaxID=4081 RepID=V9GZK6_SOLLC|nr:Ubc [Solanum lycopersicum]